MRAVLSSKYIFGSVRCLSSMCVTFSLACGFFRIARMANLYQGVLFPSSNFPSLIEISSRHGFAHISSTRLSASVYVAVSPMRPHTALLSRETFTYRFSSATSNFLYWLGGISRSKTICRNVRSMRKSPINTFLKPSPLLPVCFRISIPSRWKRP